MEITTEHFLFDSRSTPTNTGINHTKILIVDDELSAIDVLCQALDGLGDLRYALEGTEALAMVAADPVDLVLLDASMPGLDGFATCGALLRDFPGIPVLFVTAANDSATEVRALACGARDFITKPINPATVRARVSLHLQIRDYENRLLKKQDHLRHQEQELRRNLRAVTESAQFNQTIIDTIVAPLVVVDDQGIIIAVNRAWQAFAQEGGLDPQQVGVGTSYFAPLDRARELGDVEAGQAIKGVRSVLAGERINWDFHFICKNGSQRDWFSMRVWLLVGLATPHAVITYENITQLVTSYEIQGRYKEHFKRSIRDSLLPKLLYRTDGTVHLLNQVWQQFTGHNFQSITTISEFAQLIFGKRGRAIALTLQSQSTALTAIHHGEFILTTANGQTLVWGLYSEPVGEDSDGEPLRLMTALDSTEQWISAQEKNRILEMSQDFIASVSAEGELHFVNPAWQRRLGYSTHTLIGKSFFTVVHPEDKEIAQQTLARLNMGDPLRQLTIRLLTVKEEIVWVTWQATFDPGTDFIYTVGRDITESHYWEEEQAATLRRYTSLVGALGDITYELRLRTRRMQWDGSYTTLLGYNEIAMGSVLANWRQHIHIDDLATVEDVFTQALQLISSKEQATIEVEYRVRHAAGHYLWFQERTSFVYGQDGLPLLALGVLRDITKQHNQQEARNQIVSATQRYLDEMDAILLVVGIDGHIIRVNRYTCETLGYSETELLGSGWLDHCVPADQRAARIDYMNRAMAGIELPPSRYTSMVLDQQGEPHSVSWQVSLLTNENNKPVGAILVGHDQANSTSLENMDTAGVVVQTHQTFITHVSHELRTPLTALLGFAQQLREGNQSTLEREQALQAILNSSQHLQQLVTDALDLSDAETGQLSLNSQSVDLLALLTHWFNQFNPLAREKGLTLTVQALPPLPRTFTSDPQRLAQLLHRLGDNAIRFTEQGAVRLLVSCDPSNERLVLSLFDSGQGISDEQARRVFQPFTQGDDSLGRSHNGLGLGLPLARRLTQHLGDDLLLESHPGTGSLFTATIATGPLTTLDDNLRLDLPDLVADLAMADPVIPAIPQLIGRILLAEDNEYNQTLITYHLVKTNAEVTVAGNGEEAFSLAMEQDFQLILMDMQMPIMGGLEATQMLRASLYPGPIVALTAHGQSYHRQEALDAGCDDFLTKPVDWEMLYQVIARYLPPAVANALPASPLPCHDDGIAPLVARFLTDLPVTLAQMNCAHEEGDLPQLAGLAHQIKGIAASLGYPALGAIARTLEAAARAGDGLASAAALAELCRSGFDIK